MAETRAEIIARLKAADPELFDYDRTAPDRRRKLTAAEYDARIEQSADFELVGQAQEIIEAEQRTVRDQVRTALLQLAIARQKLAVSAADRVGFTNLPAWGAATAAQRLEIVRIATDEALQDAAGLIRVLVDRALIERDEP